VIYGPGDSERRRSLCLGVPKYSCDIDVRRVVHLLDKAYRVRSVACVIAPFIVVLPDKILVVLDVVRKIIADPGVQNGNPDRPIIRAFVPGLAAEDRSKVIEFVKPVVRGKTG